MTHYEITIPFSGFYDSIHDSSIDDVITMSFDYEGTGMGEENIPDDFYDKMQYGAILTEYARAYSEWFNDQVNDHLGTDLNIQFKSLVSPREYNFGTDRIFCSISDQDILTMYDMVDRNVLEKIIKKRFTSRSGFSSFYQNSLNDTGQDYKTSWCKPVLEWDHNQLATLLIACIDDKDFEGYDDLCFYSEHHETIHNIVRDNAPDECITMLNDYDQKARMND